MCAAGAGFILSIRPTEPTSPRPELPIHDSLLLNSLLIGAGLTFGLGAATLLVRRSLPAQCLGLGAMLLAVALSFVAFGQQHGQRSGWQAAGLVLAILLGHGWLAAGLLNQWRSERQTWEEDPPAPPTFPAGMEPPAPTVLLTVVSVTTEELPDGEEP